jgi:myo-inositol-1(or 4)-monophosphatase
MIDSQRLALAEAVAAEAGQQAAQAFRTGVGAVRTKRGPHDVVTETDERIERWVAGELAAAFGADGMVGEEGTSDRPAESGITWTVDPVDGTWNFAAGLPQWCVVVACADEHGPLAGAIADPLRDELWSAVRGGGGLRLNGAPAPPRPVRDLADSTWAAALGPRFTDPRWQRLRGRIGPIRMMGSLALDLAWTAAGRYDAFVYSCALNPWDVWAGQLMGREQGLELHPEPEQRMLAMLPPGWWEALGLDRP